MSVVLKAVPPRHGECVFYNKVIFPGLLYIVLIIVCWAKCHLGSPITSCDMNYYKLFIPYN